MFKIVPHLVLSNINSRRFFFVVIHGILLILGNICPLSGEGNDPNLCKGITCKPKPTAGFCIARNATTLGATTSYGEQR